MPSLKIKLGLRKRQGTPVSDNTPASAVAAMPGETSLITPGSSSATPATTSDTTSSSREIDPWTRAFEIFREREPGLIADYEKFLASLQDNAAAAIDFSDRQSVECIVEQLLEEREKKKWRVSLLDKDIEIRKQTEKLAKFLLWSKEIIKEAVSAQPYAALAWSGVSLLLPLLTSGTTQNEAMLNGFSLISNVQVYWNICETPYLELSRQQNHRHLTESLAKLYSYIVEYQARVICHLSRIQLTRAWQDVTGWNEWTTKAAKVKERSDECSKYIAPLEKEDIRKRWNEQLQEIQQSRAIVNEVPQLLKDIKRLTQANYEDQTERALLEILASDYEDFKDFNEPRVDGTCEWFFQDDRFHNWRDSPKSSLLWVSAGPGCGKSVLSRALVDEHRLSTNITTATICYFFFKDGDQGRMHSYSALCAVLHQLFTQDRGGNLIANALPSHKHYSKSVARNFSKLWDILLECTRSPDFGEVVCIFDALDECEEKSRNQLINKLKRFYCDQHELPTGAKLKFLITSRAYDNLELYFAEFTAAEYLRLDGSEKSADISREINLVIDHLVKKFASGIPLNDQRKLSDSLKSMKQHTYLWLYLIFDIVKGNLSSYKKSSTFERLLSDIPSQVTDAYEKILSRSRNEGLTIKLLQIMLGAARPLTLHEANIALTIAMQEQRLPCFEDIKSDLWPEGDFKSTVQNLCGLFISVYDSKLYFIHQTAREFLILSKRQGRWQGQFSMPESHSTMSQVCINYLLLPDLTFTQTTINGHGSLLSYSAYHWHIHYNYQEYKVADQSRKDARKLCNPAGEQTKLWISEYRNRYLTKDLGTELHLASHLGLKLVVEDLVKEQIDINTKNGDYYTALQAASEGGHYEIIQLLLDKGADVNAQGGVYNTALQAACLRGHSEIVQLLLDKGADVNAQGGIYNTALQAACYGGHSEIVQLLLHKDAEINAQGEGDNTALQSACVGGHYEIVQMLLLDKGADVNAQGGYHNTALQSACVGGHYEIVQLLLDKGADVNAQGGDPYTALQAACYGGHSEIVQLLLYKDAEINAQGGGDNTALQAASEGGHYEIIQLLLDKGADVNAQGGYDNTALQAASLRGYYEIVQLLLDKGADVNAQGGVYNTALQSACVGGHYEIVQLLLHKGADVNAQGGVHRTALQAATDEGYYEVVQLLLDTEADVNI